ncbi:MAG: hypothetical protein FWE70_03125, partial [Oscillospiraceae bacterium]|nr:hypothetical protein [Oscillospiraceae bacterium]
MDVLGPILGRCPGLTQTYWGTRAYSQLQYAANLDKGREEVKKASAILLEGYEADKTVTEKVGKAVEAALLPMSGEAKKIEVLCMAHAHIDMNWMWRYDETVSITLDTFRTMLQLMDEYPQYTFSQSQASVYEIVEKHDREMLERIKARVKEGRWEVTASHWVEADKNMPSAESFARHL